MSSERVAELALINLAYAQAEIMVCAGLSEHVARALRHIMKASANLQRLAPRFDYPFPMGEPDELDDGEMDGGEPGDR